MIDSSSVTVRSGIVAGRGGDSQFADVCEVDEGGFLGSHSDHLRRLHHKLPLLSGHHVRVLLPHDVENSVQELRETKQRVTPAALYMSNQCTRIRSKTKELAPFLLSSSSATNT